MIWEKTSEYSIASKCGKYHIARAYVQGQESYMLWHERHILGCWGTAKEAKQNAEKHKGQE